MKPSSLSLTLPAVDHIPLADASLGAYAALRLRWSPVAVKAIPAASALGDGDRRIVEVVAGGAKTTLKYNLGRIGINDEI